MVALHVYSRGMTTYYRIQAGGMTGVSELTSPDRWWSINYGSGDMVEGGVSAMRSIEELAEYIAQSCIEFGDDPYLVTLEAITADVDDDDAALGVYLVQPSAIVAAEPVPAAFYEMVNESLDTVA